MGSDGLKYVAKTRAVQRPLRAIWRGGNWPYFSKRGQDYLYFPQETKRRVYRCFPVAARTKKRETEPDSGLFSQGDPDLRDPGVLRRGNRRGRGLHLDGPRDYPGNLGWAGGGFERRTLQKGLTAPRPAWAPAPLEGMWLAAKGKHKPHRVSFSGIVRELSRTIPGDLRVLPHPWPVPCDARLSFFLGFCPVRSDIRGGWRAVRLRGRDRLGAGWRGVCCYCGVFPVPAVRSVAGGEVRV